MLARVLQKFSLNAKNIPSYEHPWFKKAVAMMQQGNFTKVITDIDYYQDTYADNKSVSPYLTALQLLKAYAHYASQDYDAAVEELEEVIKNDPNFLDAYRAQVFIYRIRLQYAELIMPLSKIIELDKEFMPDWLTKRAAIKYRLGDWAEALSDANKAIELDSLHIHAQYVKARCQLNLGRHREVEAGLTAFLSKIKPSMRILIVLAEARFKLGMFEEAIAAAVLAISNLDIHVFKTLDSHLKDLKNQNRHQEIIEQYEVFDDSYQLLISALFVKCESFISLKRYQDMLDIVGSVRDVLSDYAEMNGFINNKRIALQSYREDDFDLEIINYVNSIAMHFHVLVAEASYALGDCDNAKFHIDEVLKDRMDHVAHYDRALVLQGEICLYEGNVEMANFSANQILIKNAYDPRALSIAERSALLQFSHWRAPDNHHGAGKRSRESDDGRETNKRMRLSASKSSSHHAD